MSKKVVIGSRESKLAVLQSEMVRDYIVEKNPGLDVEILTMKTTGDKILDRTLDKIGGKGLFVKELDKALLEGKSQLSVHSLKDMPMEVPDELPLLAFSKREDPRDVLVLPEGVTKLDPSKPIGCSSLRRTLQLKELYPDMEVKSIRGNLQTRLKKLDSGEYSALILAAAGLKRLGLEERISRYFSPDEMIPAAGQGILAVQGKNTLDYDFLEGYDDRDAHVLADAERAFVKYLDGGCTSPVAAYGEIKENQIFLRGLYYDESTGRYLKGSKTGSIEQPEELGISLAKELKEACKENLAENKKDLQEKEQKVSGKNVGKVWLVGAGPGDVGLFTLKGLQVLEQADVVVYDSLVGQGILTKIPYSARLINVGKRAGHHTMPQEQINQVLLEEAKKGNKVVRLKGGDPFLFGRGGEELELLTKEGIPYEIVPGVTSPVSVPAYNGIPVTHRDFCSSVHIITGHKRQGMDYDIDFEALVHTKGTLVFLMGVTAMEDICQGLMKAGMSPDMPAAVLAKGTTAGQRRVVATVATLKEEADRQKIQTPAIIVVGKVCTLADDFAWYEKLPLAGFKILVTRPKENISRTAAKLREKGAEVLELPSISITPLEDQSRLYQTFETFETYDWLVFTSPLGVEIFWKEMAAKQMDVRRLGRIKIAVIGEGTKKKLLEKGIYADFMPSVYDGDTLGKELAEQLSGKEKILIPRALAGNQNLVLELEKTGAQVDDIPTYHTEYENSPLIDEKKEFEEGNIDLAVFTSASTVKGFVNSTKGLDYSKVHAACIGKQTKAAADAYGMITYMSEKATIDSLIELVMTLKRSEEKWN